MVTAAGNSLIFWQNTVMTFTSAESRLNGSKYIKCKSLFKGYCTLPMAHLPPTLLWDSSTFFQAILASYELTELVIS